MRIITETIKNKYDYEFIFVNDGSKDKSLEVLKSLARKDKKARVFGLSRNFGHQAAVSAGLDKASGEAVIIMDADLQDPPSVCLKLIEKWEEGYEVVYAQRITRQDSLIKKTTASLFYKVLAWVSSVDIPKNTGDFRLVDKKVVNVINSMRERNRFLRGMFSFAGFKQVAVPFDRDARLGGKSEYTLKKLFKLAMDGIFGFSEKPLKLSSRLGFIVSGLSVIGIFYALIAKLFFTVSVPGWTMITVSIFFMGGVQLVILGIIGEYISRIHDEVRERPIYIVDEEINGL